MQSASSGFSQDQDDYDVDRSRTHTLENVLEYLEAEIGEETLMQCYPVLIEIGPKMFQDDSGELMQ